MLLLTRRTCAKWGILLYAREAPAPQKTLSGLHEFANRFEDSLRVVAMRGVTAVVEGKDFDRATGLAGNGLDLRHGSVWIVEALNGQDRAADAREILFDVPAAEVRMEPDVVPSPEGACGVAVMAGELLGKVGGLECSLGLGDAGDTEVLDEDVRREEDEAADTVVTSRINQGNGSAIAVADEDGVVDLELGQQSWERVQGFVVHVGDRTRFSQKIGVTGAVAGIDANRTFSGGGNLCGEISPVRDRAQAFVKEYEFGSCVAGDALSFEAMAADGEMERLGAGISHRVGVMWWLLPCASRCI